MSSPSLFFVCMAHFRNPALSLILVFQVMFCSAQAMLDLAELGMNRIELNEDSVRRFEANYISALSTHEGRPEDCERLATYRAGIVFSVQMGFNSSLFPEIMYQPADNCTSTSPYYHYIIGNAWYNLGEFDRAIGAYLQLDSTGTAPVFALGALNLSAAYASNDQNDLAIATLEKMQEDKRERNGRPWNIQFLNQIRINLAALYLNAWAYEAAENALNSVDSVSLDSYWRMIWNCNRLMCYQRSMQFGQSKRIWESYLKQPPLHTLPGIVHEACISEALKAADIKYFLEQRKGLLSEGNSPLLETECLYHDLLLAGGNPDSLAPVWDRFKSWEDQFQTFINAKKLAFDDKQVRLANLESQLEAEIVASGERLIIRNRVIGSLIVLGLSLMFWRVLRLYLNKRQLKEAFQEAKEPPDVSVSLSPKLDHDDIRLIGEAIAYGRNTADAMLILKKINLGIQAEMNSAEVVDLSQFKAFKGLNHTELQVAQYVLGGFHSKDIARLLKCSTSHIYNTRSKIRIKLDIDDGESIEDFCLKHID